jgi:uncharacterized protein with gpF-like domain
VTATAIIINGIADELLLDMRWDAFAKTTLQIERGFKPVLRRLFDEQKAKVLQNIAKNPPPEPEARAYKQETPTQLIMPWLLDPQEWHIVFENAAKPFVRQAMNEGYDDAIRDIEAATDVELGIYFDVSDPNVSRMMNHKLKEFSFRVNQTTNKMLKKTLIAGLENNENIRMISQRVADVFGQAKSYRTERIARTEVVGAHNAGGYRSKVDSGIVKSRKWIATRDARTREAHAAPGGMDGEVALLTRKYSNGLMFPGDWRGALEEFINCRCTEIVEEFKGE